MKVGIGRPFVGADYEYVLWLPHVQRSWRVLA